MSPSDYVPFDESDAHSPAAVMEAAAAESAFAAAHDFGLPSTSESAAARSDDELIPYSDWVPVEKSLPRSSRSRAKRLPGGAYILSDEDAAALGLHHALRADSPGASMAIVAARRTRAHPPRELRLAQCTAAAINNNALQHTNKLMKH